MLNFAEEYGSGNDLPQPPTISIDSNDSSTASQPQFADFQRKSHRAPRPISYPYHEPDPIEPATIPATNTLAPGPQTQTQPAPPPTVPISTVPPATTNSAPGAATTATPGPASNPPSPRVTTSLNRTPTVRQNTTLPTPTPAPNGHTSTEMPAHERKVLFYGTSLELFFNFCGT